MNSQKLIFLFSIPIYFRPIPYTYLFKKLVDYRSLSPNVFFLLLPDGNQIIALELVASIPLITTRSPIFISNFYGSEKGAAGFLTPATSSAED